MKVLGYSIRIEIVLLSLILLFIINMNMVCGCSKVSAVEGLTIAEEIINEGTKAVKKVVNKHMNLKPKEGFSVENHMISDKDEKMRFFEESDFSTECCPSKYTSSKGCACLSLDQTKALKTRGGNSTQFNGVV